MGNALGALVFFLIAPGTVLVFLPLLLGLWRGEPSAAGQAVGGALVVLGVAVLIENFIRFVRQGRGTPNPLQPATRLVVSGLYRWVRNPIYLANLVALLGEALFFANAGLVVYAAVVWFAFHVAVTGFEEPALRETFGAEFESYAARVPRWIPRPPR